MSDDARWMRRCLVLARRAEGRTAPNPIVGCVIVSRQGEVLAEGWHKRAGAPHGEADALAKLAGKARGATLYVNLEPCNHQGRTAPCAPKVIAAGIRRVVYGAADPIRGHAGGARAIAKAGIAVTGGVLEDECVEANRGFFTWAREGRPFTVLKAASSLDGRAATHTGHSQWITGEAARADAHRLRAESDAVLVGAGTVRADDPSLTVRLADGDDPRRVVLGRAPAGARVHPATELEGDLGEILDGLGGDGVVQLLVEGGATVAHAFHAARLVDRYVLYLAPALFGGDDGRGLFAGPGAQSIDDLWRGRLVSVEQLGPDLRVELGAA